MYCHGSGENGKQIEALAYLSSIYAGRRGRRQRQWALRLLTVYEEIKVESGSPAERYNNNVCFSSFFAFSRSVVLVWFVCVFIQGQEEERGFPGLNAAGQPSLQGRRSICILSISVNVECGSAVFDLKIRFAVTDGGTILMGQITSDKRASFIFEGSALSCSLSTIYIIYTNDSNDIVT